MREIEKATKWQMVWGRGGDFVVFARGFSLQLRPNNVWANKADGGHFVVRWFKGRMLTPPERGKFMTMEEPKERPNGRPLTIHREPEIGWCWHDGQQVLTHDAAADALIRQLVEMKQEFHVGGLRHARASV